MDTQKVLFAVRMVAVLVWILANAKADVDTDYGDGNSTKQEFCSLIASSMASRRFSYKFFKTANMAIDKRRNVLLSPFAVGLSLAMVSHGAMANTKEQIIKALEQRGETNDALDPECVLRAYYGNRYNAPFVIRDDKSMSVDHVARLRTAARLFGERAYVFRDSFVQATGLHGAEMDVADFQHSPSLAARKINLWVSGQTDGYIPQILKETMVSRSTVLSMISAIHFKGSWKTPFVNSTRSFFRVNNVKNLKVNYMTLHSPVRRTFSTKLMSDLVEVPYASPDGSNVDARLILILPQRNVTVRSVGDSLSDDVIMSLLEQELTEGIDIHIPKFKFYREHKLKFFLRRMGIRDIFTQNRSNLTAMAFPDPKLRRLFLPHIQQKSFFKVDEHGTLATSSIKPLNSHHNSTVTTRSKELRFDRPFLFLLYEKFTDNILFIGKVTDPRKGF